ncbi:MAG: FCD domain-containing protein [Chloroflexota bacterium]|nr:FCD domain-containing protein [Chloroflexota bacterium]
MSTVKLNRATLAEQVAEALIDRIEVNGLKPGDPLPSINRLADEFGVSKPIIREALRTLEGRELIVTSNGRAPMIKPISGDSLRLFFERAVIIDTESMIELLEIRRGLEIQSVTLAARKRTDDQAAEMRSVVMEMREHLYDPNEYTELDIKLHFLIASASRNTLMLYLIQSIRDVLRSTIKEGLRSRFSETQIRRVQELHEAVVDAVTVQDVTAAAEAMAAHFDDAIDAIYRSMLQNAEQ